MLKHGLINIITSILRLGLSFVTIPALIYIIGIEEYGLWTLINSVILVFSFAEVGISYSTTVFLSKDLVNEDSQGMSETIIINAFILIILATLLAFFLVYLTPSLVDNLFQLSLQQQGIAIKALQLGSILVWIRLIQQLLIGIGQAYQKYFIFNLSSIPQILINSLGMLLVAWMGGKSLEMMYVQILGQLTLLFAHMWLVYRILPWNKLKFRFNYNKLVIIAKYSLMTDLTLLGGTIFTQCDRVIVGTTLGTSTLGIYAAITSVTNLINALSGLSVQPLLSNLGTFLSSRIQPENGLTEQIKKGFIFNSFVALGIASFLFNFTPFILKLLISDFVNSEYITSFRLATIVYAIYSLNAVGYYIAFSTTLVKQCLVIQLMSSLFSLLFIFLGSQQLGLIGAILGNCFFTITLTINFLSLGYLNINKFQWLRWIFFPVVWFVTTSIFNYFFLTDIVVKSIFYLLEITILITWFCEKNELKISSLLNSKNNL